MSNQPPNVHKDTKIHRDDLEMWCQTAAHCAKFRSALKQVKEIEKQGGSAHAWWKGIEVVVKRDEPKITMLEAPPMGGGKTMIQSVLAPPASKTLVVVPSAPKPVTESQSAILAVLLNKMTTSEVAAALSKPVAAVNSSLQSLKTAGRVLMEVTDSGLVWAKA